MRTFLRLAAFAALLTPTLAPAAFAFDAGSIKPHMEVVGEDGQHVGTVDKVEGEALVLTKDDPAAGGVHHQLPITAVDTIDQGKVKLHGTAISAKAAWQPVDKPGNDKAK